MSLPRMHKLIRTEIKDNLSVIAAGYPVAKIGEVFEQAAEGLQALGIGYLLVFADPERFHRQLTHSAYARRYFLRRSQAEGNVVDLHLARSRWESYLCALASGYFTLAHEIGDLEAVTFNRDGEYEDDFCFYLFLHQLLRGAPAPDREQTLARFAAVVGTEAAPRLDVCRALHAADPAAFELALRALLDARQAYVDEVKDDFDEEPTFLPMSKLFVEGLALMKIAEALRIGPRAAEYPLCPKDARVNPLAGPPPDIFAEIDQIIGP